MATTAPDGSRGVTSGYFQKLLENRYKNPSVATGNSGVLSGKAPEDPRITQRVTAPTGAAIPTSTKTGAQTVGGINYGSGYAPTGGTGGVVVQSNPYESYYNKMVSLYEKQMADEKARQEQLKQERIAAANKIKDQRIAAANTVYDTSKANLDRARDDSLRQAYIKHMQEQKALPQQMQAFGINGGATETNLANMKNVYGTNRANIMNEAMEQQRYLEQDRANAIAGAEAAAANAAVDAHGDATNYEASAVREYNNGLLDLYASALNNSYKATSSAAKPSTASIRNNQWYKQATSLLADGNNRDEVIAYLDQNGVSEEIIDAILNDWDTSF